LQNKSAEDANLITEANRIVAPIFAGVTPFVPVMAH